jgi:hypothetical protein
VGHRGDRGGGAGGLLFATGFNKLKRSDIGAQEALGCIDVQLTRRAELVRRTPASSSCRSSWPTPRTRSPSPASTTTTPSPG